MFVVSKEEALDISKRIDKANKQLKKEFVGIDKQIDKICGHVEAWMIFKSRQKRPYIVNLFGMTGVGKTSVIQRLFELLEMTDIYSSYEMGEFSGEDARKFSSEIYEDFSYRRLGSDPSCIVLDEFQKMFTKTELGGNIKDANANAIWNFLDTGHVYFNMYLSLTRLSYFLSKLSSCISMGCEAKGNILIKEADIHKELVIDVLEKYNDRNEYLETEDQKKKRKKKKHKFLPDELADDIERIWRSKNRDSDEGYNLYFSIQKMDHEEIMDLMIKTLKMARKESYVDYSSSIIFLIANVDSAYGIVGDVNPDVDPDIFYKHTLKIGMTEIKASLLKLFRAEQLARMGNNFVVYPSFSSQHYRDIIKLELEEITQEIKEKDNVEMVFDSSVEDLIYKEGVFPTQGARPIFSTINDLIIKSIASIPSKLFSNKKYDDDKRIKNIVWEYAGIEKSCFYLTVNQEGNKKVKIEVNIDAELEKKRQGKQDDQHALIAVHEAGHAIAEIIEKGNCPNKIVTSAVEEGIGGFIESNPDETNTIGTRGELMKDVVVLLGGIMAESTIFGSDDVSMGASGDLKIASSKVITAFSKCGMDMRNAVFASKMPDYDDRFTLDINIENYSKEFIDRARKKCKNIMDDHRDIILKLSRELLSKTVMYKAHIMDFLKENNYDKYVVDNPTPHLDAISEGSSELPIS